MRVLSRWVVVGAAVLVAALTAGAVLLLFFWLGRGPLGGRDRAAAQRSTELQVWQHERDLAQRDEAQRHVEKAAAENQALQERVAASTEAATLERRVTELYAKAADQLGSERALVRMAGLYALERLAQAYHDHRQTVVNVYLCVFAYTFRVPNKMILRSSVSRGR